MGSGIELHGSSDKQLLIGAYEYDANDNAIYVGEAAPGTSESSIGWRIKYITYDANNNATTTSWASGNPNFDKIFDDRAGYTYS